MQVDFVLPVHDEASSIEGAVRRLQSHLQSNSPYPWKLILADHGSSDGTFWLARRLAERLPGVEALQVAVAGRGRALRRASQGFGDIFCYLDLGLPADLDRIFGLTRAVAEEGWDLAVGRTTGRATNGWRQRLLSGGYALCLRVALRLPVADPACPFKALSRRAALDLLPKTNHPDWFFDIELLALARARGYRIGQVDLPETLRSRDCLADVPFEDLARRAWDLRMRLRNRRDA
jgi:glycosyltransferase involved in cell wall biosynthesis